MALINNLNGLSISSSRDLSLNANPVAKAMLEMKSDRDVRADQQRLFAIADCCDTAFLALEEIRAKVLQIIAYKKSTPQAGGDALIRRQVSDFMSALENLASISESLDAAVREVKELCMSAHLLLGKGASVGETIGVGFGAGAGVRSTSEKEEDADGGKGGGQ